MAQKLIQDETLRALADAIRLKTDSGASMTPARMGELVLRTGYGNIPAYHYEEAQNVIAKIREIKMGRTDVLVFGVITDSHVNVGDSYETLSKTSARHGAFALETVGRICSCDFLANLGDNCWGNNIDTAEDFAASSYLGDCTAGAFDSVKAFHLVGNHDQSGDTAKVYQRVGERNAFDTEAATEVRGYGYSDFEERKVRVIVLNTSDYWNTTGGYDMSYEQKDFLMRALDLSGKAAPGDWQIVILSHFPLDYPDASSYNTLADVQAILAAYAEGNSVSISVSSSYASAENEDPSGLATYSGGNLQYDYSGRNSARIVGNFHGHVHNVSSGKMAGSGVVRVSAPNTCFYLEKGSVEELYTVDVTYGKTRDTAQDTAVTFYAVDLTKQVIHAFAYGSGIDRTISYAGAKTFRVTYNLTGCTSSASSTTAVEGTAFSASLTPAEEAEFTSVIITMGGTDITDACWDGSAISIENVTGDIVITAAAQVPQWSETVADVAVAIRQYWYFGSSSTAPELNNDNAHAAIGTNEENAYGYADRESGTIYLLPVPGKATKITISNSDGTACSYRYRGVKSLSDGTFSLVFDSGDGQGTTWTWDRGSIDFIMASANHTDGTSWSWGYDDSKVGVLFTNY